MTNPSPLQLLVEDRLREPLGEFLQERRRVVTVQKPLKSWQDIAAEIHERTGVAVTRETLRNWGADLAPDAELDEDAA